MAVIWQLWGGLDGRILYTVCVLPYVVSTMILQSLYKAAEQTPYKNSFSPLNFWQGLLVVLMRERIWNTHGTYAEHYVD